MVYLVCDCAMICGRTSLVLKSQVANLIIHTTKSCSRHTMYISSYPDRRWWLINSLQWGLIYMLRMCSRSWKLFRRPSSSRRRRSPRNGSTRKKLLHPPRSNRRYPTLTYRWSWFWIFLGSHIWMGPLPVLISWVCSRRELQLALSIMSRTIKSTKGILFHLSFS